MKMECMRIVWCPTGERKCRLFVHHDNVIWAKRQKGKRNALMRFLDHRWRCVRCVCGYMHRACGHFHTGVIGIFIYQFSHNGHSYYRHTKCGETVFCTATVRFELYVLLLRVIYADATKSNQIHPCCQSKRVLVEYQGQTRQTMQYERTRRRTHCLNT